jgi:hypothetical protein
MFKKILPKKKKLVATFFPSRSPPSGEKSGQVVEFLSNKNTTCRLKNQEHNYISIWINAKNKVQFICFPIESSSGKK